MFFSFYKHSLIYDLILVVKSYSLKVKLLMCPVSGARCVSTLLYEMKRRGKDCRYGVISMCIGESHSLSLVES